MTLQIHELTQGSDAWLHFRQQHFGASEAAAMLGLSPHVKRTELLHIKTVGLPKEFSDWVQENILDYGHEVEALARPLVESIIEDDLYPVTCSVDVLPPWCAHQLSASLDGLTMSERIVFEHKQWSEALAAAVASGELPEEHAPQCQQELLVTGAEKLYFVVSDGTSDNLVYVVVYPDPVWFERLKAGWEQFAKDMADYKPRQLTDKPEAAAIIALPALVANIHGEVTLTNLPTFKAKAERFIASIKTDLQDDQDFADAELTIKFCDAAEKDIERAKGAAIAQTASIDDLMRTVDLIKDQLRAKRLMLTKLVDRRKIEIKETILSEAKIAYAEHVTGLEAEIKPLRLGMAVPDFAGAMKNKRTLASLHDAVDTLLASAKIATNTVAADYRAKQTWCRENAKDFGFLFMDMSTIIAKPMEDFQLVINTRIAAHKQAEEQKAEAERARIREEERVRAEKAAAETIRLAQVESDRVAAVAAEAERERVKADTKRQLEAQAAALAVQHAPAPASVTPPSAQPELARQASFYSEAPARAAAPVPHRVVTRAAPRPVIDMLDTISDTGPSDAQIIAFGAEHDMEIDELIPRLERFIADARAGALAAAA